MQEVKNTQRALVRIGYDGLVHKTFRGPQAYARFENEVRVLRHLEARGCNFVPKLIEADATALGFPGVVELANSWVRSLNSLFSQPTVRQFLVVTNRMPPQITYQGRPYTIRGEIAPDRGLFRTNGRKVEGKVIFWEIPADTRTYQVSPTPHVEPDQPSIIYLLHRRLFFVPYQRS